jgi:DNA-binding XRE family transcriptional regulator
MFFQTELSLDITLILAVRLLIHKRTPRNTPTPLANKQEDGFVKFEKTSNTPGTKKRASLVEAQNTGPTIAGKVIRWIKYKPNLKSSDSFNCIKGGNMPYDNPRDSRRNSPPKNTPSEKLALTSQDFRDYRKSLGMTQERFSKKFGVPLSTVKKWEQGLALPRISRGRLRLYSNMLCIKMSLAPA